MAYKLIVTLDDDMDKEDAAAIADELQNHEGVAEVEGMGWNPWADYDE